MRPGPRSVTLNELDDVLDRATALMGPAPDEARALLDGIVLALPTAPPDDPFSDAYREWTWELYRTVSGRAAYDTAHEASPFDLAAALSVPSRTRRGRWRWWVGICSPGAMCSSASPRRRRSPGERSHRR